MRQGFLLTFEGTDGAGKSTLIGEVSRYLQDNGISHIRTREPGGAQVAERIRSVIVEEEMHPWTELFLYLASRAEHVQTTIIPALKQGRVVLCDRYTDSSLAYQGAGRGLPVKQIRVLNDLATQKIRPKLTVFLDVDPESALKRVREVTRFERAGLGFQKKVRAGYLKAARAERSRFLVIRAQGRAASSIAEEVIEKLEKRFKFSRRRRG